MPSESMDEPFRLRPPEPPRKQVKFENAEPARQNVLFAGLNCLPGQENLFATDGKEKDDAELDAASSR